MSPCVPHPFVVALTTRHFDRTHLDATAERLAGLVDELAGAPLHLDFAGVEFLTAAALGKLASLHRRARTAGAELVLRNVTPLVYEVFDAARLTAVLDVEPAAAAPAPLRRVRTALAAAN